MPAERPPPLRHQWGARGRVTYISPDGFTLAMNDGRTVALPATYARTGALELAYAITGHLAQAATFEAAIVVGPPHHHTRQWSYAALSRSRTPTQLVVLAEARRDQPVEHAPSLDALDTIDALTRLATCMTRDEAETERRAAPLLSVRQASFIRSRTR